jgi:hypothetical protein
MKESTKTNVKAFKMRVLGTVQWLIIVGTIFYGIHLSAENTAPHFATEIVPILTKAGCNSGACHGAATGKGSFKLSLFAEDAVADFEAISRDRFARRLNVDHPEKSLILKKASKQIEHEGGRRIRKSSQDFETLKKWITVGAPKGNPEIQCVGLEISPQEIKAQKKGDILPITVEALMADGSKKNVTRWCVFESMDDGVADVTGGGEVVFQNHGVTSVMIRFGALTSSARIGLPYPNKVQENSFIASHPIDQVLIREWKKWNLKPAKPAKQHSKIRRIFLDLTGHLPTSDEAKHWIAILNTGGGYHKLVKHLLSTPSFADYWSLKFADWLLIDTKKLGAKAGTIYYEWIRTQIQQNNSMLSLARSLLETRGSFLEEAPSNFHRHANDPRDMAEYVGQTLLGARIACARCHNHPVDRWTLTDYHDFAAVFSKTGIENGKVVYKDLGKVPHPKTGQASVPRPLGVFKASDPPEKSDPLKTLGHWLETEGQDQFARAFSNRIWKQLFGRGVVEPVDDLRSTNPSLIPNMLETIVLHWSGKNYRFHDLIELLVTSNAYQQSADFDAVEGCPKGFFNAMTPRELDGRVLVDAIREVTDQTGFLKNDLNGSAIASWDHRMESFALDVLGRCQRDEPCADSGTSGGGLSKSLYLFNDPELQSLLETTAAVKIQSPDWNTKTTITELYWKAYSRKPSPNALHYWSQAFEGSDSKEKMLSDMMWAILNSREFIWNH